MRYAKVSFDFYFDDEFDLQSLLDELETMGLSPSFEEFEYEEDEDYANKLDLEEYEEEEDEPLN